MVLAFQKIAAEEIFSSAFLQPGPKAGIPNLLWFK